MKKVFVTDQWFPLFDEMERRVNALDGELVFASATDDDTLIQEGSDSLCVFNSAAKLRPAFLRSLKNCRTIVRTGIGIDTIDVPTANEMGIRIANVPDYCQSEVADHAVTLALSIMRKIPRMNRETRSGIWKNDDFGFVPRMNDIMISVYLALAMCSMKLWQLVSLFIPLLIILVLQVVFDLLYTRFLVYPTLKKVGGSEYDAAVMCSGFLGHTLGCNSQRDFQYEYRY